MANPWPLMALTLPAEEVWLVKPGPDPSRCFRWGFGPTGAPALVAADGKAVKGFPRARKSDDARLSAQARARYDRLTERHEELLKAQVKLLKEAFIQGDSWTLAELAAPLASPTLGPVLAALWWRGPGEVPLRLVGGAPVLASGAPASLEEGARLALLHPARLSDEQRAALKADPAAELDQLGRTVRRGSGTELAPIYTDWARTQNDLVTAILTRAGWTLLAERGFLGAFLFHRTFRNFGCVAELSLDEEHGIPTLRFRARSPDGTVGEVVDAATLDPQAVSEGLHQCRQAYPHDPDSI